MEERKDKKDMDANEEQLASLFAHLEHTSAKMLTCQLSHAMTLMHVESDRGTC